MKKFLALLSVLLLSYTYSFATHNRAGEITYKYISGTTYGITITTYTNTYQTQADRCELEIFFGDGTSGTAPRINGPSVNCTLPDHDGDTGISILFPNTKLNIYYIEHTYPGPSPAGGYRITMDDQNRNAGTCNIDGGNSVNVSFSLESDLVINPFLGPNDSPILLNYPLDQACENVCFYHNPGAYDPDGDSLYYTLTTCLAGGNAISNYSLPPNMGPNSIDHFRGDLVWCSPNQPCQYSIAIKIEQWRRLQGSPTRYYIGSVLRDMQITVGTCANNPPQIKPIDDTCITAGSNLHLNVSATDVEFNTITLNSTGGPYQVSPAATFGSTPSFSPVNGVFNWTPSCTEVQLLPYLVTFKATDSGVPSGTPLVDFRSIFIRVIAPAPTNLTATPAGASMVLNWTPSACNNPIGQNPLLSYNVYRINSCDPWVHSPCETGVPSYTGYTLIGTTNATTTTFTDNNNGQGLTNGINYSYVVAANYSDGSQSYASAHICKALVRDVPIITNVSVLTTDPNNGSIWVHWVKPLATVGNLDTVGSPPPYEYRLMKADGFTGTLFNQVSSYSYAHYYELTDTGFVNLGLNTQGSPFTYRVDFYANGVLKGSTNTASSVFLSSTPAGNQVHLSWQEYVPWLNFHYYIYRALPSSPNNFVLLDSTIGSTYIDTGLVNGRTYCYKVITEGEYTDTALPRPLYNSSQIKCEVPVDLIPPCQPAFTVASDCGLIQNVISWTNPNTYCCHDAVQINIYFAPTTDATLQLIQSFTDMSITSFSDTTSFQGIPSVAGCYAVTALDTAGNESPIVTKTCVDNCPEYELPNVFTPNGDGQNDVVTPLPGYRFVKDVEMKIFDRWGLLMFETTDKDILWDGKNKSTKALCTDGVYFYVCTVNEIRVDGIQPRVLKGFIQLLHEKGNPPH